MLASLEMVIFGVESDLKHTPFAGADELFEVAGLFYRKREMTESMSAGMALDGDGWASGMALGGDAKTSGA